MNDSCQTQAEPQPGQLASIYLARHKESGKSYVGFTTQNLETRRQKHLNAAKHSQSKSVFHKAIRKYGGEAFEWKILFKTANVQLAKNTLEPLAIKRHDTKVPNGFNLTSGGDGVVGHAMPMEARERISKSLTGKKRAPFTDEHKRNLSRALRGRVAPNKGTKASLETRKKLSLAHMGIKPNAETRMKMSVSAKKGWSKRKDNG